MSKQKKKITKEEKLLKDRQRKKEKYQAIKNDPELYEIQKEKERNRYLLRKEKKNICSIKELTPRAQREQRKKWRNNSAKHFAKKKEAEKIERIILEKSPPPSDTEDINVNGIAEVVDPLGLENNNQATRQNTNLNIKLRRLRYRYTKIVKQLQRKIKDLENEVKQIKISSQSKENKIKIIEDSVEKRVNEILLDVESEKVDQIKKKLLFGESISKNLQQEYQTRDKKNKKPFIESIIKNRDKLKQYRILGKVPFSCRKSSQKPINVNILPELIKRFLEDDANSSLAPGKKEFIKTGGEKKQKRYLRDNLRNLYDKFCKDEVTVGYSTFCRYRPSWIVTPNARETCGCKLHTNVDLIFVALKKAAITKEGSGTDILKSICCNTADEKCLDKKCQQCKNKVLAYKEFNNDQKIVYFQWMIEKQVYKAKDGKDKMTTVTIKKRLEDYPRDIILNFEQATLPKFLMHTKNIVMQYAAIKKMKQNMKHDETLIHIDFSENYCFKHNSEIQSFHFGGSRGQVSLHTGVLYYVNPETGLISTKSFCTVSKCLQHDAASIWAHLNPVLDMTKELVPALKSIHFLSDSPTSQYRNKYIFYLITKLNLNIPSIEKITWNYLEAGHGKGAPDGIGAVVKRTADNFVKYGGDVGSFNEFVEVVSQDIKNVKIIIIDEDKILNIKFPKDISTFKGTMNVHQALWCLSLPYTVAFRKLSCFDCLSTYIPCSHGKHLGVLSIGIDNRATSTSNEVEMTDFILKEPHVDEFSLVIDGPHNFLATEIINEVEMTNSKLKEPQVDQFNSVIEGTHNVLAIQETTNSFNNQTSMPQPLDDISYLNIDSPTICNNITNIDDTTLLNAIDDQLLCDSRQTSIIDSPKVQILSNVPFDWQRYTFYNKKTRAFHQHDQDEFKKFISDSSTVTAEPKVEYGQSSQIANEKINTNIAAMDMDKENVLIDSQCLNLSTDDWVIVEYKIKTKIYAYIGKITECSNGTYTILFLKKSSTISLYFTWPTVKDEDTVSESRVLAFLQNPTINRRGQYYFENLPDLNYR